LAPSSIQSKDGASGLVAANPLARPSEAEKQWLEIIVEFRPREFRNKIITDDLESIIPGFFRRHVGSWTNRVCRKTDDKTRRQIADGRRQQKHDDRSEPDDRGHITATSEDRSNSEDSKDQMTDNR